MRFLVAMLLALFPRRAPAQSAASEAADAATFRATCGSCHSTSLVEGLRTEEEWREEIDQMIKVGARGTAEQFERVMRVLAGSLTKVNVNTAEARQIAPVLGVTAAVADAVVKRRSSNGKFRTIEDLKQVAGVDAAKLEARKDRIMF